MSLALHNILRSFDKYHEACCGESKTRFVFPASGHTCCDACVPKSSRESPYQILKYTRRLCVRYTDIKRFVPSKTDVMWFISNGDKVTTLRPMIRQIGTYACLSCTNVVRARNQYCSLACLLSGLEMNAEESDEHLPVVVIRRRRRKQQCPRRCTP